MGGASARRRLLMVLGAPVVMAASNASLPPLPDPYAAPPKGAIETMLRDSQFGKPGADAAIERWLAQHPAAAKADRVQLWHRLCGGYGAHGWYAAALRACTAEAAIAPKGEADDDIAMARVLHGQPPIRAVGTATVPLTPNKLGSRSATVEVNGFSSPWFIDSGAEVSVVSQSVADRIKVRMLPGIVQVGTTTAPVKGHMAVVDLLRIGNATVENLPVLVLPDAQLTIAGLPTIPAIFGLPAMVAFGRVAWLGGGSELALGRGAPAPAADSPHFYWHQEGIGVPVATARGTRGAHLDTGANRSYLRGPGVALLTRAELRGAREHEQRLGGAGGVVQSRQKVVRRLTVRLAGAPVSFDDISIAADDHDGAARIGDDAVAQLAELSLDFDTMRVAARALPAG